jgi:hypothetical protein
MILSVITLLLISVPITTGQEDSTITLDFTIYDGNPILPRGAEGEWDAFVGAPRVIYHNGLFHMFYLGSAKPYEISDVQVGYATSEDGLHWTKYAGNPVEALIQPSPLTEQARSSFM